jgi:hypothetical protein
MISNAHMLYQHVVSRNHHLSEPHQPNKATTRLHESLGDPNSDPANALLNHRSDHTLTQTR